MSEKDCSIGDQYLTFFLGNECYGISIGKVREVLSFTRPAAVPCTPDYIRGVINLRGNVVPVLDLKLKLGSGRTGKGPDTCVIIVSADIGGENLAVGFLADSMRDVYEFHEADLEPPPGTGLKIPSDFISWLGKRGGELTILLNPDRILDSGEL